MSDKGETGVLGSLRRLLETGLSMVQNRVELFGVELQEEKCRLAEIAIWVSAVVGLGLVTVTVLTLTIIVLFWENGRIVTLVTLSVFYLLATLGAYRALNRRLRHGSQPFPATLSEIDKDKEWLKSRS